MSEIVTLAAAIREFDRLCPISVCPALTANQDAVNERQQVAATGTPTSGAFTLTVVNPVTLVSATASANYNSTFGQLQTALEALLNVAVGDVVCTGGPLPGTPIAVQFAGEYAGLRLTLMTATDTFNVGDVVVTVLVAGLPVGEVPTILAQHKRASLWSATTAYQIGAVVIPTAANRNGRRYRLIRFTDIALDQLSGASEPSWPTSRESTVTDNHVVWEEDGDDYGAVLWDFTAAARDGWTLKASKAVSSTDIADPRGMSIKGSQLYDHCINQANRLQSAYVL